MLKPNELQKFYQSSEYLTPEEEKIFKATTKRIEDGLRGKIGYFSDECLNVHAPVGFCASRKIQKAVEAYLTQNG